MRLVTHLIVPDLHAPYHDEKAWALLLKVGRVLKPQVIVTLGDFVDNYCVSAHRKNPRRARELSTEIDSARTRLAELGALNAKEKHFIAGNHEHRLERYLCDKAPELYGMISVEQLLGLKKAGWSYTPYGATLRLGDTRFTHDLGSSGEGAPNKARDTYQANAVIGHVHGMRSDYKGAKGGHSFGWLGNYEAIDYMHQTTARYQWQHGCGIGYLDTAGRMRLVSVPFTGGACVVEGRYVSL